MGGKIDKKLNNIETVINRTYIYLFPMLGIANSFKLDNFLYFEGIYLKDDNRPDEKDKLYLLLKFSGDRNYVKFEERLRHFSNYVDSYDPDKYHAMFVFNIPSEFKREYDLFMKGKYSEFSENYKQCIALFHNFTGKQGESIMDVLYKREQAYLKVEHTINEGLPKSAWTKIPRDQEIGRLIEEVMDNETYKKISEVKESINDVFLQDNID